MKLLIPFTVLISAAALVGCATLTNDPNVPIAFSMSDGSNAECTMINKRGNWKVQVPDTAMIRRSDDALRYNCTTEDGRTARGSITSTIGAKMVAAAVCIVFGITDAITDKHREYPASFVIPVRSEGSKSKSVSNSDETDEQPAN